MRSYLDRGYTVVKKKIGGASLDEDLRRIESVLGDRLHEAKLARRRQRPLRPGDRHRLRQGAAHYDLFWYEEPGDPLDFELQAALRNYYTSPMATGENLFSMQDARNLIRYGGMRPGPRLAAVRLRAVATAWSSTCARSTCSRSTAGRRAAASRTAGTRCRSTSPPASGSAATRPTPTCSSPSAASPTACKVENSYMRHARPARHRLRGQVGPDQGHARAGRMMICP